MLYLCYYIRKIFFFLNKLFVSWWKHFLDVEIKLWMGKACSTWIYYIWDEMGIILKLWFVFLGKMGWIYRIVKKSFANNMRFMILRTCVFSRGLVENARSGIFKWYDLAGSSSFHSFSNIWILIFMVCDSCFPSYNYHVYN